jgi:hypothetical protein
MEISEGAEVKQFQSARGTQDPPSENEGGAREWETGVRRNRRTG